MKKKNISSPRLAFLFCIIIVAGVIAVAWFHENQSVLPSKTIYHDTKSGGIFNYRMQDDMVLFDCQITLINPTESDKIVSLSGVSAEDSGYLLKDGTLTAKKESGDILPFLVKANSQATLYHVIFRGEHGTSNIKQRRKMFDILIEELPEKYYEEALYNTKKFSNAEYNSHAIPE